MDQSDIEVLRAQSAAWRLLRAVNSALILSFLGLFFVDENRGATSASVVAAALEDHILRQPDGPERYPREPAQYLEDWGCPGSGLPAPLLPAR